MRRTPRLDHKLARLKLAEEYGLRPLGYAQKCREEGEVDERAGVVRFTAQGWLKVNEWVKTRPTPVVVGRVPSRGVGLGDIIASVATPIARAMHMDCIDPATSQLKPDSGCQKRKDAANAIRLPFAAS